LLLLLWCGLASVSIFKHILIIFIFILASVGFMSGMVQPEKKMIAVYPVFLFFLVLSWFVLDL
jgi:hypothetical protein